MKGYYFLIDRWLKTRKIQRCFGCLEFFPKGSEMRYRRYLEAGVFYSNHVCNSCSDVIENLDQDYFEGGFQAGDLAKRKEVMQ